MKSDSALNATRADGIAMLTAEDPSWSDSQSLFDTIDLFRLQATRTLDPERRGELGQFLTPGAVARLMASMFGANSSRIALLDAGAGSGSLFAAAVLDLAGRDPKPTAISVTAFEIDDPLVDFIRRTVALCGEVTARAGIDFSAEIVRTDFIAANIRALRGGFFAERPATFTHAILNPPYGKISGNSETRRLLNAVGVQAGNLYVAFLAVAVELLEPGGELVAITPRSFCNGPYFRSFRRWFLARMALQRIHVFESRSAAFRSDEVLQENIIFHAVKTGQKPSTVIISASEGDESPVTTTRTIDYCSVVHPDDRDSFIHIVADEWGSAITQTMSTAFRTTLDQLGITVSTGRVVDFRVRPLLRQTAGHETVPLIYPTHFDQGFVRWPKHDGSKPNAIVRSEALGLTVPAGMYVLVKRFSAKEERRRIVAAVYDSDRVLGDEVAFENHLNYFHDSGYGLSSRLAKGLAAFLNSSLVDQHFRQFSGHTQVNATDLRRLRYPGYAELERLGDRIGETFPDQRTLDQFVREELLAMADQNVRDPILAKDRIEEALEVLRAVGMPKAQLNEHSALTLLALLNLKPETRWYKASEPLRGITPIMEFAREFYGKNYAPNTRETVRRQTMHQFVDAGIVIPNPDDPARAVNSPDFVYQIEESALALFRSFKSRRWKKNLAAYLASTTTLRERYAQERHMQRIAIKLPDGVTLHLTPGGQNILIEKVIDDFCSRFTPGGVPLYVGDTGEKFAYFDRDAIGALGVTIAEHGKMPDVVVHHLEKDWLVVIEAVTSHGPVDPKRRGELKTLFRNSSAGLVFVTAFLSREAMVNYASEIAWQTEVWIAEEPNHLIHFNGERFLGPYEDA